MEAQNQNLRYSKMLYDIYTAFENEFPENFTFENVFDVCVESWNLANVRENLSPTEYDRRVKGHPYKMLLEKMVAFKLDRFDDYKNVIIDYTMDGENLQIKSQEPETYVREAIGEMFSLKENSLYTDPLPYFYESVNRSAVSVKAKEPFYDWLNSIYPNNPVEPIKAQLYLIREKEDHPQIERWIKRNFDKIFDNELNDWNTDHKLWPQKRTFKIFSEWFEWETYDMVLDTEGTKIGKD